MSHSALGSQFTDLYHGTNVSGLETIHHAGVEQGKSGPVRHMNFTSNNPGEAAAYAESVAEMHGGTPTVYEVEHEDGDIEPDDLGVASQTSSDFGSIEEAEEYVGEGGWTTFQHHGPLKVVREMSAEDARREAGRRGWGSSWR